MSMDVRSRSLLHAVRCPKIIEVGSNECGKVSYAAGCKPIADIVIRFEQLNVYTGPEYSSSYNVEGSRV
jgi:hypothetical protein